MPQNEEKKRRSSGKENEEPNKRLSRSQTQLFDFQDDCLFCAEPCKPKDPKHPNRWNSFRKCDSDKPDRTPFKETVINICNKRSDNWSKQVEVRLHGSLADLAACGARYHTKCYDRFRKLEVSEKPAQEHSYSQSLQAVVDFMSSDKTTTWTVSELYKIYCDNGGRLTPKQMVVQLKDHYDEEIVILNLEGCSTIIGFRSFVAKTLKLVKSSESNDSISNIVRKVQEEVKSIPTNDDYDMKSFCYDKVVQDTSPTLLALVSGLVSNGETSKVSLTLSQCIQQHISKSSNQTTLGLAVKLHHKFGSSDLVQTLYEHGIVASYGEVLRFRKSAAKYTTENSDAYHSALGFECENGPILSWCDNYDLVVFTPNGQRGTHAMAVEFTQHPSGILNTVKAKPGVMSLKIPRISKPEMSTLKISKSSVPLEHYTGSKKSNPPPLHVVPATPADIDSVNVHIAEAENIDARYLCQVWSDDPIEWSGFNSANGNDKDGASKAKTSFLFGPLIDSPPSHPDTVFTTMSYIERTLQKFGMAYVYITMDMQLYIVACQIKWNDPPRWISLILSPGMMHTLMSFLGTVGNLMKCTGLEELIGASFGGTTSILNGKAWPKAMRAFRMVLSALLYNFLSQGSKTYQELTEYLEKSREHPTGKLWVDCFVMPTLIALKFLRAERQGDWLLQQHCLQLMLPYFFAAGHHHYARYITWHIRDMQHIPDNARADLLNGAHVCRHADCAPSVSADQFGEQTFIKQGKEAGGMKGISTNPEQVAVWIESFTVCTHVSMAMSELYNDPEDEIVIHKPTKHKEEGQRRRALDKSDRENILKELQKYSHPLDDYSEDLHNTINGQVASLTDVNVHGALDIGKNMQREFESSLPEGLHKPIPRKVKTMLVLKQGVKIKGKTVYDLKSIFSRLLIVGPKRNVDTENLFQFELCSVPPALIDEYGCLRKGNKSELVHRLCVVSETPTSPTTVIVDASQLLYHVVWPAAGTVNDVVNGIESRLKKFSHINTFVIFDWYDSVSAKDHERHRRAGESSNRYQLTTTSILPGRDVVLKCKENKKQLASLLSALHIGGKIELVSQAASLAYHDEADVTLVSYMLKAVSDGECAVRILSDDTDVFVLLVYWCWKRNVSSSIQMERWDGSVLDINKTVEQLGDQCQSLLAVHALTGCDTVSFICGKGKVSASNTLPKISHLELDSVYGEETATDDDLVKKGMAFLLALYNQTKCISLNAARYRMFLKQKVPRLQKLPPTDANFFYHVKRAHLQVMLWKAADKPVDPEYVLTDYGWQISEQGMVLPTISKQPVAPEILLDDISCTCSVEGKVCTGNCGCVGHGISCTPYCACEGGATCGNPFTVKEVEEDDETECDNVE